MKTHRDDNRFDARLKELIATASEFAFDYSTTDTREAYNLARVLLVELLKGASTGNESIDRHLPETMLMH